MDAMQPVQDLPDIERKLDLGIRAARVLFRLEDQSNKPHDLLPQIRLVTGLLLDVAEHLDRLPQETVIYWEFFANDKALAKLANEARRVSAAIMPRGRRKTKPVAAAQLLLVESMTSLYLECAAAPSRQGAARSILPVLATEEAYDRPDLIKVALDRKAHPRQYQVEVDRIRRIIRENCAATWPSAS
jgi:hypothetical protein